MNDLQEALDVARAAARAAGTIQRALYQQSDLVVDLKPDRSPVTRADRESEAAIRAIVSKRFPDDGFLGEESGANSSRSDRRWIVDPLDGTRSFVRGVPLFGVMVAMEQGGEVVLGVVHFPALDETIWAARGLGAFWTPAGSGDGSPRQAKVSAVEKLSDALLLYTCAKGFDDNRKSGAFERLRRAARVDRGWGDCYGHMLVATGRADVMLDPAMHIWDCAALLPILRESGGTFTDWTGRSTIDGGDALSTNGHLFDEVMSLVEG